MADTITDCDLDLLFTAIQTDIAAAFPSLQRVTFDELDRENLPFPSCLLDCCEMDNDGESRDPGTEQQALTARFEARFILGFRTLNAKMEARKLATAFCAYLRTKPRWPRTMSPAAVIGCYRDEFDPRLDQYEVWRVEWTLVLHFGSSVWTDDGLTPTPTHVFLGQAPDIGPGHEADYIELTPP